MEGLNSILGTQPYIPKKIHNIKKPAKSGFFKSAIKFHYNITMAILFKQSI